MKYNQLGQTGILLSEMCLGAMTFGGRGMWQAIGQLQQDEVNDIVKTSLDYGINFIDTANAYSEGYSEMLVGNSLKVHSRQPIVDSSAKGSVHRAIELFKCCLKKIK